MNWLKQNRINWIKMLIGIVILGAWLWANGGNGGSKNVSRISLRCPESYENSGEKIADLKKFADNYYSKNPNASEVDLAQEMLRQWKANNCSLKRYNDFISGNVDAKTKNDIYQLIDEYTNSTYYENAELGFSFRYPNNLIVGSYPEQPNWVVVLPKSKQANDKEPMTAIIISTSTDDLTYMTPEEWLNGPNSGYKASRDGQYKHIKVGGQDAVITSNDWTIVKSPDGQMRISIAYLVEKNKGAKPLKKEFQTIIDTFAFK